MEEVIFRSLSLYYGMDWLALMSGTAGMYLITRRSRWGFLLSAISSLSGFAVAGMSLQLGFLVYNFILVSLTFHAFLNWEHKKSGFIPDRTAAWRPRARFYAAPAAPYRMRLNRAAGFQTRPDRRL
jgi:hypothetical protein